MWNEVTSDNAADWTDVPATEPAAREPVPREPRATVPDWALAFGGTLPVIGGSGEARHWPRVIP